MSKKKKKKRLVSKLNFVFGAPNEDFLSPKDKVGSGLYNCIVGYVSLSLPYFSHQSHRKKKNSRT
jgi:hypothetical protein